MIERQIKSRLVERLQTGGKVVLVYGARQVGKTTLVRQVLSELNYNTLSINADEGRFIDILSSRDLRQLRGLVAGYEAVFIDEAQRIPEIGINLKLLVDHFPQLRLVVTGSSSLDLASKVQEPLTGRTWIHTLYPIATSELGVTLTPFNLREGLTERLIYGSYPEIFAIQNHADKRDYLLDLTASYLYKDILEIGGIRNPVGLRSLVRLLAHQIGQQISLTELGTQLQISKDTVASYIDLLEKSFVVFRLSGFSRNLRKEISKQSKIYFWDVGVRNAVLDDHKRIEERPDRGQLWENFVIAERLKYVAYARLPIHLYFWRTYDAVEIDIVEEQEGALRAVECKWGNAKSRLPASFQQAYPGVPFETIRPDNFLAYLTGSANT